MNQCQTCGRDVAPTAATCPSCGAAQLPAGAGASPPGGLPPGGLPPGGLPPGGLPPGGLPPGGLPPGGFAPAAPAPLPAALPASGPPTALPTELAGEPPRPLPAWAPRAGLDLVVLVFTAAVAAAGIAGFGQLHGYVRSEKHAYITAGVGVLCLLFGIGYFAYNTRLRRLLSGGAIAVGRVLSARIVRRRHRSGGKTRTSTSLLVEYEFGSPQGKVTGRRSFSGGDIARVGQPGPGQTAWVVYDPANPRRSVPWGFELTAEQQSARDRARKSAAFGTKLVIGIIAVMVVAVGAVTLWGYHQGRKPAGGASRVAWDGKSSLICQGGDHITVTRVTAELPGIAVTAQNSCELVLDHCHIVGDVAVVAMHGAQVRIVGGAVTGRGNGIALRAVNAATIAVEGASIYGAVERDPGATLSGVAERPRSAAPR